MQEVKAIARDLMEFLDASPVNFYAARTLAGRLDQAGYTRLDPAFGRQRQAVSLV